MPTKSIFINLLGIVINPWVTMRTVFKEDPKSYTSFVIFLVFGIVSSIGHIRLRLLMGEMEIGDIPFILALTIIPIVFVCMALLMTWITQFSGHWLGGKASFVQMMLALAWGQVLLIFIMIGDLTPFGIFISLGNLFPDTLFSDAILPGLGFILWLWGWYINFLCISIAQGFNFWYAVLNCIIALAILAVPLLALYFGLFARMM